MGVNKPVDSLRGGTALKRDKLMVSWRQHGCWEWHVGGRTYKLTFEQVSTTGLGKRKCVFCFSPPCLSPHSGACFLAGGDAGCSKSRIQLPRHMHVKVIFLRSAWVWWESALIPFMMNASCVTTCILLGYSQLDNLFSYLLWTLDIATVVFSALDMTQVTHKVNKSLVKLVCIPALYGASVN